MFKLFYKLDTSLPLKSARNRANYHWYVVATVCIGAFMAALDASVINIALPTMQKHFTVPMHVIEWVSLVYLLTLTGLVVPFGRIADMVGRRWMYAFGFTVFVIGSVLCGLSMNLTELLVFRCLQAVGAAMLQANSVSIVTAATPAEDRGKAIGIQASAQGIGLTLGPAIGGALLSLFSWRWIFLINLPVGIVGTTLGILLLPPDKTPRHKERFDYVGAALLIPSLVALIFMLNMGLKSGWTSLPLLLSYVVFVVCLSAFMLVERRINSPMVDLSLFRKPVFTLGNITGILSFAIMYAVLLLTPFYLDGVARLNPFLSGLLISIIPVGMTIMTPIAGLVSDKKGRRLPTVLGMLAALIGCVLLSGMSAAAWSYALLSVGLFLVGAGVGLFTPPNNSSVMGSVPENRLGVTGGILNMSRSLGMGLGVTLGGLTYQIFLIMQGVKSEKGAPIPHMIFAFHASYITVAIVSLVAVLLSLKRQTPVVKANS
ncbi:MFS transporter [Alicyclobacillus ferrooxydans]|uniref:MFS transporter n=1 Tax=Alicyclobacillus ferrooxydans TaxID=471514 RepID=UPI0006D5A92D|nr:MFS transporter [Alicyclobacillus ferrooxydans]